MKRSAILRLLFSIFRQFRMHVRRELYVKRKRNMNVCSYQIVLSLDVDHHHCCLGLCLNLPSLLTTFCANKTVEPEDRNVLCLYCSWAEEAISVESTDVSETLKTANKLPRIRTSARQSFFFLLSVSLIIPASVSIYTLRETVLWTRPYYYVLFNSNAYVKFAFALRLMSNIDHFLLKLNIDTQVR